MWEVVGILASSLSPVLSFLLLVILSLVYFFRENISSFINNGNFNLKHNLKSHDLFNVIDRMLKIEIFNVYFDDDVIKTKVFRDFMKIKLEEIKVQAQNMINDDILKLDSTSLKFEIANILTDMIHMYNIKAVREFRSNGLTQPQINYVMSVFDKWSDDTMNAVRSRINSILGGSYHKTNHQKIIAIFEVLSMAVELSMTDGVKGFNELNGYFKSIKYDKR